MKKICLILVIMLITVTIGCNRNQDNSNTIVDNEDVIGIEGEADKISEIDNTEIDFEFNENTVATGYNAHQCYGNIETEDDLFLQDIDLLDKKDWAKQSSYTYEFISGEPLITEREINDRIYYYVFTDFREHDLGNKTDRLLFVVKREDESYEIVKAYYLAADVKIRID